MLRQAYIIVSNCARYVIGKYIMRCNFEIFAKVNNFSANGNISYWRYMAVRLNYNQRAYIIYYYRHPYNILV